MAILEKSMKTALDTALNEILKDWKWKTEDRFTAILRHFRFCSFLYEDAPNFKRDDNRRYIVIQKFRSLGFVRGHARTQSGNTRWRFPKYARRPRKGITIFAYSFAPFYYGFHAVWMCENVATKANVLLNAPANHLLIATSANNRGTTVMIISPIQIAAQIVFLMLRWNTNATITPIIIVSISVPRLFCSPNTTLSTLWSKETQAQIRTIIGKYKGKAK